MFKLIVLTALVAIAAAAPAPAPEPSPGIFAAPIAYSAPFVAAPAAVSSSYSYSAPLTYKTYAAPLTYAAAYSPYAYKPAYAYV